MIKKDQCSRCKKRKRYHASKYCKKCKEYCREYMKIYCKTEKFRKKNRDYQRKLYKTPKRQAWLKGSRQTPKYKEWARNHQKEMTRKIKFEILEHYGKKCICCGETHVEFLSVEHSKKDGAKHRRRISNGYGGYYFYCKLKKLNYPQNLGIVILCLNCNLAKGTQGYCPHEKERKRMVELNHA